MKKSYSIVLSLAVVLGLSGFGAVSTQGADEDPQLIAVGKKIFFDKNLSVNKTQSCASCHDPGTGFTGPDSEINAAGAVEPGAIPERFGNRKPPGVPYTGDSQNLRYDEVTATWFGGMFWDGRATGETLGDPWPSRPWGLSRIHWRWRCRMTRWSSSGLPSPSMPRISKRCGDPIPLISHRMQLPPTKRLLDLLPPTSGARRSIPIPRNSTGFTTTLKRQTKI